MLWREWSTCTHARTLKARPPKLKVAWPHLWSNLLCFLAIRIEPFHCFNHQVHANIGPCNDIFPIIYKISTPVEIDFGAHLNISICVHMHTCVCLRMCMYVFWIWNLPVWAILAALWSFAMNLALWIIWMQAFEYQPMTHIDPHEPATRNGSLALQFSHLNKQQFDVHSARCLIYGQ